MCGRACISQVPRYLFYPQFCDPDGLPMRVKAGLAVARESDDSDRICVHFPEGDIGTKDMTP